MSNSSSRRQFLRTCGVAAGALSASCRLAPSATPDGKRPNLIYIFADQLRADTLGFAGDKKAITPNFDRFAAQGLRFNNAVSVMPVCAAYRSSLLTGKYPSSTGMVVNELCMNPNHRSIAHVLGDANYNLGYFGKWHLVDPHGRATPRGPARLGFDGAWAAYNFNHQSYNSFYWKDAGAEMERVKIDGHGPTAFTNMARDFIADAAKQDRPFGLVLSWNPPHDPWSKNNVPKESYELFKDMEFSLPENFKSEPDAYMDRYPQFAFEKRDGAWAWKQGFLDKGLAECLRCYYAMIHDLDKQFGRLMKQLDELGIAADTVVVFSSDHGETFGSHGRMFKLTFYEEAANIPLVMRWPGRIAAGTESDALINTPDLMPTMLGLLGLESPPEVEGRDLSRRCLGQAGPEPEFAFLQGLGHTFQWLDGFEWRAVRDKRYTYAKYLRDGKELLYDRREDPGQKKDVAADPKYRRALEKCRAQMAAKMKELDDEFRPCTWYRDHWMYKDYSVAAAAKGKFGPLPPMEPIRGQKK